ncbi:hypothetical protein B1B04_13850 [Lysinibacillus sp. KCTC 33748]|uniref:DUF3850 domain-containing protein n=1 Tax=unclassified Lysinibacillus TaxID=2636778 RepID=UPI0009A86616|nr:MULTISPECIES: DUF3850 domain-containing protein [unclassified Lysinibacillus]OXS73042.1 hypothetical protein B1B04_13850 [Lysinibacillus sp. KCTC 33748]SKB86508.1 protein of unknown function [Lysinibacillus sp. AC-3]
MKFLSKLFRRNNTKRQPVNGLENIPGLFELDPKECNRIFIRDKSSPVGSVGSISGTSHNSIATAIATASRSVLVPKIKKVHEIDIETEHFIEIKSLRRTFEIQNNEVDYKPGDVINYREKKEGEYTGYNAVFTITYITSEKQKDGFIVMGKIPYSEKPRCVMA